MVHWPFLASSVPNLSLENFIINPNASGGKLNPNGGLWFKAEFVLGEPRQKVRFSHTRVPNQYHLEQIIVILISSIRPHLLFREKKKEKKNWFWYAPSLRDSNGLRRIYILFWNPDLEQLLGFLSWQIVSGEWNNDDTGVTIKCQTNN